MYYAEEIAKKRRHRLFIVVIATCLAAAGAITLLLATSQSDSAATNNHAFVKALTQNDAQSSFAMMTSRLQEEVGGPEAWSEQVTTAFGSGGISHKFNSLDTMEGSEETYGETTRPQRALYDLIYPDGTRYKLYIIYVVEDDDVKVDEFDSYLQ